MFSSRPVRSSSSPSASSGKEALKPPASLSISKMTVWPSNSLEESRSSSCDWSLPMTEISIDIEVVDPRSS